MRANLILFWLLLTFAARAATPEVGKDALRKLVKLPTVTFQADWTFDPERGFTLGSSDQDATKQIADLRKDLKPDSDDPAKFGHLAELYTTINDGANAKKSWTRAAELYRNRVETQPDDAIQLADFGRALEGAGKTQEAESVLRRAVRIAPKEWKCFVALGRFLDADARRNLYDTVTGRPAPAKVALARNCLTEAGDCFARAVVIAPDEGEIYLRRGLHLCLREVLFNDIRLATGEEMDEVFLEHNCFSPEALADLQHACRLSPKDYSIIGATVLFEVYADCGRNGLVDWTAFSWNALSDKSQRSIREAMAHLENLGQDADPHLAAGSLETLGILQGPVFHQLRAAVTSLRRAIVLDPDCEQAWEILISTLARSKRYDELKTVCEARLKHQNSARNHLLLAKAFEKLQLWDEAEGEIMESVTLAPNNFTGNLAMAALLLRHSQRDGAFLEDANNWLGRTERLLNEMPPPQRSSQQIIDFTLTRSIYFALTDEVATARQWAQAVINQDKENRLAQDILSAMDY